MVYSYLLKNYKKGEPIFLSDIKIEGVNEDNIRYHFKQMTKDGRLCRFDTGIYYLPKKDFLGENETLSTEKVAISKYIHRGDAVIGFYSGFTLANKIGLSTQVPYVEEITSNNAPALQREITIKNRRFLLRRPLVEITKENATTLQLLECLKNIDKCTEIETTDCGKILTEFIKSNKITKNLIDRYISFYPLKTYKALYETGVVYALA